MKGDNMDYKELIERLATDREWAQANEWESPICLQDDLSAAIAAVEKLKAYEDTGLEPEEIERIVDAYGRGHTLRTESAERLEIVREIKTDRLRELAQADKAGRLVVLPCKVGDTIYYTREGRTIVEPIKARTFFVGDPTRRGEILHLHMIRTDVFDVSMDALGKTVFLTREEAEAALAEKGVTK